MIIDKLSQLDELYMGNTTKVTLSKSWRVGPCPCPPWDDRCNQCQTGDLMQMVHPQIWRAYTFFCWYSNVIENPLTSPNHHFYGWDSNHQKLGWFVTLRHTHIKSIFHRDLPSSAKRSKDRRFPIHLPVKLRTCRVAVNGSTCDHKRSWNHVRTNK